MKTLKILNSPLTVVYFLWCTALIVACWDTPADLFPQIETRFQQLQGTGSVVLGLAPLLTLVGTGLLTPNIKAVLVFWRRKDVLPGHRAFSVYGEKDVRVNQDVLRKLVSPWPKTPVEENHAWYSLSKRYADAPSVSDSHRMFLLWRDITACSAVFGVVGTVVLVTFGNSVFWALSYALIIGLQFLVAAYMGRIHGERFVCNVLAEASSQLPAKSHPEIIIAT